MAQKIRIRPGALIIEQDDGLFIGQINSYYVIKNQEFFAFIREIADWREPLALAKFLEINFENIQNEIAILMKMNLVQSQDSQVLLEKVFISHFNEIGAALAAILFEAGYTVSTLDKRTASFSDVRGQFIRIENMNEKYSSILENQQREIINSGFSYSHNSNKSVENIVVITTYPEPELLARLMSEGTTHIFVASTPTGVRIGPIVVPGITPCFHCIELHCSDGNPQWHQIATTLFITRYQPIPMPRALLAASVVAELFMEIQGRYTLSEIAHGASGRIISLTFPLAAFHSKNGVTRPFGAVSEPSSPETDLRWEFHPECSCHW